MIAQRRSWRSSRGAVGVFINNTGSGSEGPIEEVPMLIGNFSGLFAAVRVLELVELCPGGALLRNWCRGRLDAIELPLIARFVAGSRTLN
mgnify:FL=1